jgi:hypothetical protein
MQETYLYYDPEVMQLSAGSYHISLKQNVIPVEVIERCVGFLVLK